MTDVNQYTVRCSRGWIVASPLPGTFRVEAEAEHIGVEEEEARKIAEMARRQFTMHNCPDIADSVEVLSRVATTTTTYTDWKPVGA